MALAVWPVFAWLVLVSPPGRRARGVIQFLPGVVAGAVVWMLFNWSRFGNPLDTGYMRDANPGLGSPMLSGLAGLLFSPSTSVLLYSPFVIPGAIGLLALGSAERERFHPGMSTEFLKRMGELITDALSR